MFRSIAISLKFKKAEKKGVLMSDKKTDCMVTIIFESYINIVE